MKHGSIAIVGSTGKTGARVLNQLETKGYETRGLSRSSKHHFDWSDQSTWQHALEGVSSVYITYYPDLALPKAESDIRNFIEISKACDIKHVVLLSGRGEEGAVRAENIVKASGLDWNIVRASWFMQNFSESFMLEGLKQGELFLPEQRATEPFIDVDDIADVAVAALTKSEFRNQLLEITGPELLSFNECVEEISIATNRNIVLSSLPCETYINAAKADGVPDDIAWLMRELFEVVLDGRNEHTTNTVEAVLGRPARHFKQYVNAVARLGTWDSSH